MSILSLLQNVEPGLPHLSWHGFFREDSLYHYLNIYPLKGLRVGTHHKIPPIHRLPIELLAEIFRHSLQSVDHSKPSPSLCIKPYSRTTPFFLGQVCSHWRNITLSTGDLWQSIFISPPRLQNIPLIRAWLTRAGNSPLSLWLFQSSCPKDEELYVTHEILLLLLARIHRWRTIHFRFSKVVHKVLLGIPFGSAAELEAARVDVRDWDETSADMFWRSIHSSPSLRRPDWVNRYRHGPPSHAPWRQLTHVTLDGLLSPDVVLNILQYCQSVVDLAVPHLVSPTTSFEMSPFVLEHLCSLRISTETELDALFQSLVLPGLESLHLTYRCGACNPHSSLHLDDLLSRSQCQLRKLTLCDTDTNASEENILDFLRPQSLQSLLNLQLFNTVSDKTINLLSTRHALAAAGKVQPQLLLLPRLEAISIRCCTTTDGVLSAMLASRLPTLRTIHVSLRRDKHAYQRDRAMLDYIRRTREKCDVDVEVS
jgi:F-box-like